MVIFLHPGSYATRLRLGISSSSTPTLTSDNERILSTQRYPREAADMSGFARRLIEQGLQQGIEQGVQRGEAGALTSLLQLRFGELPDVVQQRLETADADTLLRSSARVLTARTLDEVLDDAS